LSYPTSLLHAAAAAVAAEPRREALVGGSRRLSHADMAAYAATLAAQLEREGLRAGDRIAVMMNSRIESVISLLAVWMLGATWVGLSPRYRVQEQRHILANSGAKLMLSQTLQDARSLEPELSSHESDLGLRVLRLGRDFWSGDLDAPTSACLHGGFAARWNEGLLKFRAEVPAVVVYTSGSTAQPKGAMIGHAGLAFRSATLLSDRFPVPNMRQMISMPVNHIGVLVNGIGLGLVAASTMFCEERIDAGEALGLIESERLDVLGGVPATMAAVVDHPAFATTDLSSLKYIQWGTGVARERDLVALMERTSAKFSTQYGMTETGGPVCYTPPTRELEVLLNTVGTPDPRIEVRIADADDRPLPAGEEGEIQARLPFPFLGYLGDDAATRALFTADGFQRTGDLALIRDDGYVMFCGRTKEIFKSGGFNVSPREIEIVLESHPAVRAAAVAARADAQWGQVGHAFVELSAEVTTIELLAWCRERLANYKVPKSLSVIPQIPRISVEKIDRRALALLLPPAPP